MSHQISFICDSCEVEWQATVGAEPDLPPHWIGTQIAIADEESNIPKHEREIYKHFCCQDCLIEYVKGPDLKERMFLVDKEEGEEGGDGKYA